MLLIFLPNLQMGASPQTGAIAGPYRIDAADVYVAGARSGQAFVAGAREGMVYVPGRQQGQVGAN